MIFALVLLSKKKNNHCNIDNYCNYCNYCNYSNYCNYCNYCSVVNFALVLLSKKKNNNHCNIDNYCKYCNYCSYCNYCNYSNYCNYCNYCSVVNFARVLLSKKKKQQPLQHRQLSGHLSQAVLVFGSELVFGGELVSLEQSTCSDYSLFVDWCTFWMQSQCLELVCVWYRAGAWISCLERSSFLEQSGPCSRRVRVCFEEHS